MKPLQITLSAANNNDTVIQDLPSPYSNSRKSGKTRGWAGY
jgi:hypothetical protein